MSEPIYPKNWASPFRSGHKWKTKETQENICPKCNHYGQRFKRDGHCQFCGYKVEVTEGIVDVTDKVAFGDNDSECLPLTRCVCGKKYRLWNFILGIDKDYSHRCIACGRKFFFSFEVKVYEVRGE